jgi:hypothetical protein
MANFRGDCSVMVRKLKITLAEKFESTAMNLIAQWNDEANRRNIQFSINYSIQNGGLSIDSLTPTKVTILDQSGESIEKNLGVHTAKGKSMLTEQLKNSGKVEEFSLEIARRCGLVVENAI